MSLLPCPFCSSKDVRKIPRGEWEQIECWSCGALIRGSEVASIWNRRDGVPPAARPLEQVLALPAFYRLQRYLPAEDAPEEWVATIGMSGMGWIHGEGKTPEEACKALLAQLDTSEAKAP